MAVRPETDTKKAAAPLASPDGELERYGVWIKAEPQDIVEEPEPAFDASDPGVDESFLTAEEERLLGSFEEIDAAESPAPSPRSPAAPAPSALDDDFGNLPPLEDFETVSEGGADDFDPSTIDISLEEIDIPRELPRIGPEAALDMDEVVGLSAAAPRPAPARSPAPAPAAPARPAPAARAPAPAAAASQGIEDVSAEFLDFEADAPAGARSSGSDDVTSEFLEAEDAEPAPRPAQGGSDEPEFESLDIDLHFDDTIPSERHSTNSDEPGFEQVSEFDDILAGESVRQAEPERAPARVEAAPPPRAAEPFDDLAALERELSEPLPAETGRDRAAPPSPATSSAAAPSASLSNELLLKIAEELSSIRSELVTLKRELGAPRAEGAGIPGPEGEEEESSKPGGFFDEEEDEVIALTGDELENILNTADFHEEAPPSEDLSPPDGSSDRETGFLDEGILPESGQYGVAGSAGAEAPIEEINLSGEDSGVPAIELSSFEGPAGEALEEIGLMSEEGVLPMTSAPEDTSYLEASIGSGLTLDLGETPLEEPDLSGFELPSDDVESAAAILEDEVADELPLAEEVEELPDITLDLETPENHEFPPAELEPAPHLPELEEVGFGDLDLHHEDPGEVEEMEELAPEAEVPLFMESPRSQAGASDEVLPADLGLPADELAPHPDQYATSLDDSFFVGGPEPASAPVEDIEELEIEEFEGAGETELGSDESFTTLNEELLPEEEPASARTEPPAPPKTGGSPDTRLKSDIRSVLSYLDKLLESLPEDKIEEFARSEHFETYKKLFEELGLV